MRGINQRILARTQGGRRASLVTGTAALVAQQAAANSGHEPGCLGDGRRTISSARAGPRVSGWWSEVTSSVSTPRSASASICTRASPRSHGDMPFSPSPSGARASSARRTVRASSAVECMNSVLRMHQSRHKTVTQGLLDLKRLYWNGRAFREGKRRGRCPYEHLGLKLPSYRFWDLLGMPTPIGATT